MERRKTYNCWYREMFRQLNGERDTSSSDWEVFWPQPKHRPRDDTGRRALPAATPRAPPTNARTMAAMTISASAVRPTALTARRGCVPIPRVFTARRAEATRAWIATASGRGRTLSPVLHPRAVPRAYAYLTDHAPRVFCLPQFPQSRRFFPPRRRARARFRAPRRSPDHQGWRGGGH